MQDFHRFKLQIGDANISLDRNQFHTGDTRLELPFEEVTEGDFQLLQRCRTGVETGGLPRPQVEGVNIIQAQNMIDMGMGVKNGIHTLDVVLQHLGVEVDRGIDDDIGLALD